MTNQGQTMQRSFLKGLTTIRDFHHPGICFQEPQPVVVSMAELFHKHRLCAEMERSPPTADETVDGGLEPVKALWKAGELTVIGPPGPTDQPLPLWSGAPGVGSTSARCSPCRASTRTL